MTVSFCMRLWLVTVWGLAVLSRTPQSVMVQLRFAKPIKEAEYSIPINFSGTIHLCLLDCLERPSPHVHYSTVNHSILMGTRNI